MTPSCSRTLTNSFRYGVTKIDEANKGVTNSNYNTFRFIDPFDGIGATERSPKTREPTTQKFVDDLSWLKGAHIFKLGANFRFTRIPKERFQTSFLKRVGEPIMGRRRRPPEHARKPVLHRSRLRDAARVSLPGSPATPTPGSTSSACCHKSTQRANYDRDGNPQATGNRRGSDDRVGRIRSVSPGQLADTSNLTITGGLRYSLYSPPYEVNGLQVAPTISMGEWFEQRMRNMKQGIPSNQSPIVTFDLAGPKNNRKGFYAWDKNNFAPRMAVAWSPARREGIPTSTNGRRHWSSAAVTRRCSIASARASQPTSTRALRSACRPCISSPFGAPYEENPAVRFRTPTTLPPTVPAAPPGGFPQTPPRRAGIITKSIDDTLVTPSAHMVSAIVARELGRNFTVRGGYVGRFGRDLLIRRDLAMPLNLVDSESGMDYFTAAQTTIKAAQARGITRRLAGVGLRAFSRNIPYWENLFPGAAGGGLSATQAVTRVYMQNGPDWITALYDMDTACRPACSIFGPYAYFAEQYRLRWPQSAPSADRTTTLCT